MGSGPRVQWALAGAAGRLRRLCQLPAVAPRARSDGWRSARLIAAQRCAEKEPAGMRCQLPAVGPTPRSHWWRPTRLIAAQRCAGKEPAGMAAGEEDEVAAGNGERRNSDAV